MNTHLFNYHDFTAEDHANETLLGQLNSFKKSLNCRFITVWAELEDDDGSENLIIVSTYPKRWIKYYSVNGFAMVDPILKKCFGSNGLYFPNKDTELNDCERRIFDEAKAQLIGGFFVVVSASYGKNRSVTTIVFEDEAQAGQLSAANFREHAHALLSNIIEEALGIHLSTYLTEREKECLKWAVSGKTDEEIATILGISRWTVVAHFQSAKAKLGVTNRAAMVSRAIQRGVVSLIKF